MNKHETINYLEFPAKDLVKTKAFFEEVFAWHFEDYGPEYIAFSEERMEGGFFKSEQESVTNKGAALVIFFSKQLEQTQAKIEAAGGIIVQATFDFPGGRRFHFTEPSGNEFAVWSDC